MFQVSNNNFFIALGWKLDPKLILEPVKKLVASKNIQSWGPQNSISKDAA